MRSDSEILTGLSEGELQALADSKLAPSEQGRLDELLQRNTEQQLTAAEVAELDALLARVDHLTVLKARARYTLQQQEVATQA
jgi:anti-sigma factor RsiW